VTITVDDKRIQGRAPSTKEKKFIKKKLGVFSRFPTFLFSPFLLFLFFLSFYLSLSTYTKFTKEFNAEIEEQFHTQKTFSVPDTDLQNKLRQDAIAKLVPLYSKFLSMYADVPFSKNKGKHLRYLPPSSSLSLSLSLPPPSLLGARPRQDAIAKLVPLYSKFLSMYADVPFSKNKGKHLRYIPLLLFPYFALSSSPCTKMS
jgi:hypothetical protein